MKVKRYVDKAEWYPVYVLYEKNEEGLDLTVELTEKELADYQRAFKEFEAWQNRLGRRVRR